MFENRNCIQSFDLKAAYDGSSNKGYGKTTGSCQDLSKVMNGKKHLLSAHVQCDRAGYTTTTYFGSADCNLQKTRKQ